jgi:hypothetical protein
LTAFKIVWRVDEEEEDDEELDDDDDDEELDELEEISWLEFVVTIFHSAAGVSYQYLNLFLKFAVKCPENL